MKISIKISSHRAEVEHSTLRSNRELVKIKFESCHLRRKRETNKEI